MKKGRHRRFEEARALKRSTETIVEPCAECGAEPGGEHASWCLAMEDEEEEFMANESAPESVGGADRSRLDSGVNSEVGH